MTSSPSPRVYLSLLLVLAASGCATSDPVQVLYDGPARPREAVVTLKVDRMIDVISIDGRRPKPMGLRPSSDHYAFQLQPRPHTVVARYSAIYDVTDEDYIAFKSDSLSLRFVGEAGKSYRLRFDEEAVRGPTPPQDTHVDLWIEAMPDETGTAPRVSEIAKVPEPAHAVEQLHAPAVHPDVRVTPLKNLKAWWRTASEEERTSFRRWIAEDME